MGVALALLDYGLCRTLRILMSASEIRQWGHDKIAALPATLLCLQKNLTWSMKYLRNFCGKGKNITPPLGLVCLPHTCWEGRGPNILYVPINQCFQSISHTLWFFHCWINHWRLCLCQIKYSILARSIYSHWVGRVVNFSSFWISPYCCRFIFVYM